MSSHRKLSSLMMVTYALLQNVAGAQEERQQLRGLLHSSISPSLDDDDDDGEHYMHRQLQTVVYIPLLPIILLCILCCICAMNNDKKEGAVVQPATTAITSTPPNLVVASVVKVASTSPVGVTFSGSDHAKISKIKPGSLFEGSALAHGMKVVSVNNVMVGSCTEAVQVTRECSTRVTILAHSPGYFGRTDNLVVVSAIKELPDQPIGVTFRNDTSTGKVHVSSKKEDSVFNHTDLAPGMEVVSINNVPIQSCSHAVEVVRQACPLVTILLRQEFVSAGVAVAVEVEANNTSVEANSIPSK